MLNNKETIKNILSENISYRMGVNERMHPTLESELSSGRHSLGKNHPIFPEGGISRFEEQIMGKRFNDVVNRYKRVYDLNEISDRDVKNGMKTLLKDTMDLEKNHTKKLEKLAIDVVKKEFNIDDDTVDFFAELTPDINLVGTKKNKKPIKLEIEFKDNNEMVNAKSEVYKRRFINAMIQGAPKKINHIFNDIDDELSEIDPRLPNKYSKIIASADYLYHIIPSIENMTNVGEVSVKLPSKNNDKPIISAQGKTFPVLVHELIKGVMELISASGLPKSKRIGKYVINNADFKAAEPWDKRLGPALWERFVDLIDSDDLKLKHYIYHKLISLPVNDFNVKMREILGGTKVGKKIIKDIVDEIKTELSTENFNHALSNEEESGLEFEELTLGDENEENGWDYEDLYK